MTLIELTAENINDYLADCLQLQSHLVKPGEPIEAAPFLTTAKDNSSHFIVIVDEDRVVAMGVLSRLVHPVRTDGYVNNIVVAPDARGKGYARIIMEALEKQAVKWSCSRMALTCSRAEVQAMYEKLGYAKKDTKFYIKNL